MLEKPIKHDVVLVGGGHSHVDVMRQFAMRPEPEVRMTLITRDANTPYSGMLPGYLAGHYEYHDCHVDLGQLARKTGVRIVYAEACGIDPVRCTVTCPGRSPIGYDLLSIDIGSAPTTTAIEGAEHAIPIKPVDGFLAGWRDVEEKLSASTGPFHLVLVGGGAAGAEVSLCLQYRVTQHLGMEYGRRLQITVLTDEPRLLARHAVEVGERMQQVMVSRGIRVQTGQRVNRIERGAVHCDSGLSVTANAVVITTHAAAPAWLSETGLALDDDGFIRVNDMLQCVSHQNVFAAGDVASFVSRALPKNGVYAVRQGPALGVNLRLAARGRALRGFRPQARTLALVSTGDTNAIASYGPLCMEGRWIWQLKDFIDRRWMRKYREMKGMSEAGEEMRCGGCGSKVGAQILSNVLEEMMRPEPDDVRLGMAEPDDAAVTVAPPGEVIVQSVDQFKTFIEDPYVFAQVATSHCLSDIYGMGAQPRTALAMVTLPFAAPAKMEHELRSVLGGVLDVLDREEVSLVGGHTGEGAELMLGLSVTGFADESKLLLKSGLRDGDAVILTKALGTGVLMAGEMRGVVRSEWVVAALQEMVRSNKEAAEIARRLGAHACTDVTGFGLLGHLGEMAQASKVHVEVWPQRVPCLNGALEMLERGVSSTLAPANQLAALDRTDGLDASPGSSVLYDPQTSGGLLIGIDPGRSERFLAALDGAGYRYAAVIGRVCAGRAGRLTLTRGRPS